MAGRKRGADRRLRAPLRSPGRPGVAKQEDRRRFWLAIGAGRSSEDAAQDGGVSQAVGSRWFREAGGMPPSHLAPWASLPSGRYLSFAGREGIALLRVRGHGVREIAGRLGRAPSCGTHASGMTISRELCRNAATRNGGLEYRATTAQWHAERAARRPRSSKLERCVEPRRYVENRLAGRIARICGTEVPGPDVPWTKRRSVRRQHRRWAKAWSPEQIPARLKRDFPEDETMRVSHEAIYQALYIQGRGGLRRELSACLRSGRALRVPRARSGRRGPRPSCRPGS